MKTAQKLEQIAQHTPGPWYLTPTYGRVQRQTADDRVQVMSESEVGHKLNTYDELLAALKQLRREVAEMTARAGWAGNGGREMADAAIAKTEGQS